MILEYWQRLRRRHGRHETGMEQLFYGSPPKVRPGPGSRDQVWTNERPALPGPGTNHRPRVTGTWVSRQAAAQGSIAVPSYPRVSEQTGQAGSAACTSRPSHRFRAGPGPTRSAARLPRTSPGRAQSLAHPSPGHSRVQRFPSFAIARLSSQFSSACSVTHSEVNLANISN